MSNALAFIAGGLLQGAGSGMVEQAKQLRDDAMRAEDRRARRDDLLLSSDLADRNATRNDERQTTARLGEIKAQGAEARDTASFNNGLLTKRQEAEWANAEQRAEREASRTGRGLDSVQTGEDGSAYAVFKDGTTKPLGIKLMPKGDRGQSAVGGLTPDENRLIDTITKANTMTGPDGEQQVDRAKIAADLARRGRTDLASFYDAKYADKPKPEIKEPPPAKGAPAPKPAPSPRVTSRDTALPQGVDAATAMAQARAAIAAGKDRGAVIARLRGWGIDTKGL